MIGLLLGNWRLVAIGAAVLAAGAAAWWVQGIRADLAQTEMERAVLEASLRDSLAAMQQAERDHKSALEALEAAEATAAQRGKVLARLKQEIDRAPDTDDGPVAPVLGAALDGLRLTPGSSAAADDLPGDAGGASVVR